jgi:hypothetical protein
MDTFDSIFDTMTRFPIAQIDLIFTYSKIIKSTIRVNRRSSQSLWAISRGLAAKKRRGDDDMLVRLANRHTYAVIYPFQNFVGSALYGGSPS